MPRNTGVYLKDMLVAVERILGYAAGLNFAGFRDSQIVVDAVLRNLEVLGEAAKRVPEDVRLSNTSIEWRRISGLRDILIHEYASISLEIIWDVIQNKLPGLRVQLQSLLSEQSEG
jgi:uncharacterized protein with HEPN domain